MFDNHKSIELLEKILHTLRKIEHDLSHSHSHTQFIAIKFGDNMASTPVTEAIGQSTIATTVPLEADGVTVTPGAAVSAQVYTISDPTIASQTANADGTATYKALAAGTATVTVAATVTDSDGTVSSFTAANTLTVTPATNRSAGLQISFSTPA